MFPDYTSSYDRHKKFKNKSLLSLALSLEIKKKTLACAIFGKICYAACTRAITWVTMTRLNKENRLPGKTSR